MTDPYKVVRDFESALCDYTGAKYAVTTTSCTAALMLSVGWYMRQINPWLSSCKKEIAKELPQNFPEYDLRLHVTVPRFTYISVPMSVIHGGARISFSDSEWIGEYQLEPLPIWDCARWFRRDMFRTGTMQCLSFHWTKHLAIGQGGCILHDNDEADEWLRRARFDGRKEGVAPKDDTFTMIGSHCYMSPRDAAEGLSRLAVLPENLQPLPNSEYPDLSQLEIFQ